MDQLSFLNNFSIVGSSHAQSLLYKPCAENVFHDIFDSTYEFIGLLSPGGTLLKANKAAIEFVNEQSKNVEGKPFWRTPWWNRSSRLLLKSAIKKANRGKFVRFETEHIGNNGKTVTVDFSLKPILEEGQIKYLLAEGRDITLRKTEESLKKEFLSMAAHELRTPITVLKLMCETHLSHSRRTGMDTFKNSELELMQRELERLSGLINDISDDTKLELGKFSMNFQEINLTHIILSF